MCTYNQDTGLLPLLDLKSSPKRLIRRHKSQPIAGCINKVKVLGFESTAELAQQLILGVASLFSWCANPRDFIAWFKELAVWASFFDDACTVETDDVEVPWNVLIVVYRSFVR